jgi:hypothetical protein
VNIPSTTSASSSTTGALTIGNGTAATNVAIGGGNVNAGGTGTFGGQVNISGSISPLLITTNTSASSYATQRVINSAGDILDTGIAGRSAGGVLQGYAYAYAFTQNGYRILTNNGTVAATFDNAQAATFAGTVTTGGAVAITAPSSQTGLSIDGTTYPEFAFKTGGVKKVYASYITTNNGIFSGSLVGDLSFRSDSGAGLGYIFGTGTGGALLTLRDSGATFAGAVSLSTAGTTVSIKSGTNAAAGTVTLSGGAATITSTAIDVNTVIVMSIKTKSGSFDHAPSVVVAAGSATIDGHNSDASTYNWVALKVD